jgi:low temperature requirement protein LtrA
VGGAAVVVACLLWWTYFGWLKEALEGRVALVPLDQLGSSARDAFSFAHYPLIGGIVGFAVCVEETVAHPGEPMSGPILAALGVGVGLFLAAAALSLRRLGGPVLLGRLGVVAVMLGALVVLAVVPFPPVVPLGIVAVALLAVIGLEAVSRPGAEGSQSPAGH